MRMRVSQQLRRRRFQIEAMQRRRRYGGKSRAVRQWGAYCGPTALAKLAGATQAAAEHAVNRIRGKRLGSKVVSVLHREMIAAGEILGVRLRPVEKASGRLRDLADQAGPLLVATCNHYVIVRNGKASDQSHPRGVKIEKHYQANYSVKAMWEIS